MLHRLLPRPPVRERLRRHVRHGRAARARRERALHRWGRRLPRLAQGARRGPHVQPGLPRLPAWIPHARGHRRGARGRARLPARAHGARHRPRARVPAAGDRAAQHHRLPDARGHQDGARGAGGQGPSRRGVRPASRPGARWRHGRGARELRGGLRQHLQRARRPPLRHPGVRHARAQLGDELLLRARGLPRLRPLHAQQLHAAHRHLRRARGLRARDHRGQGDGGARRAPGGDPHRLGRPGQALGLRARALRRRGAALREDLGVERPRRVHDPVPARPGRAHRQLRRGDQARHLLRPAGARRRVQARGAARGGRATGRPW